MYNFKEFLLVKKLKSLNILFHGFASSTKTNQYPIASQGLFLSIYSHVATMAAKDKCMSSPMINEETRAVMPEATTPDKPAQELRQAEIQTHLQKWKGSDIFEYGRKIDLLEAHEKPDNWWRQRILLNTLQALETSESRAQKKAQAIKNLETWAKARGKEPPSPNLMADVLVIQGDWGEVTASLTRKFRWLIM